jgi:hypothetical protein
MNTPGDFWHLESPVVVGFVGAILALLVAFGLPLTDEQKKSILELAFPLYMLIGAFVVRQKVVPVKTLEDANVSVQAVKDQAAVNQEAAKKV